jgi:hypothetical protein
MFKLADTVQNKKSRKLGTVVEVNDYYGWCLVLFEDGCKKRYDLNLRPHDYTIQIVKSK